MLLSPPGQLSPGQRWNCKKRFLTASLKKEWEDYFSKGDAISDNCSCTSRHCKSKKVASSPDAFQRNLMHHLFCCQKLPTQFSQWWKTAMYQKSTQLLTDVWVSVYPLIESMEWSYRVFSIKHDLLSTRRGTYGWSNPTLRTELMTNSAAASAAQQDLRIFCAVTSLAKIMPI